MSDQQANQTENLLSKLEMIELRRFAIQITSQQYEDIRCSIHPMIGDAEYLCDYILTGKIRDYIKHVVE